MMFPKILLLFAFILIHVVCFSQTEKWDKDLRDYEFKDFSIESENHLPLKGLLFKADSIVFKGHDSLANKYSYKICVKVGRMRESITCNHNIGVPNVLWLDVYTQSDGYSKFYKGIEATYDTISKSKHLFNLLGDIIASPEDRAIGAIGFASETFTVGFVKKENLPIIGYKSVADTISCRTEIVYDGRAFTIGEYDGAVYFKYTHLDTEHKTAGLCFSITDETHMLLDVDDVLSRKEYLNHFLAQATDKKGVFIFLQKMGLRWNIFGIYLSPKFS